MRARGTERGQVLILLATWLYFGGGATSALVIYDRPASETTKAVKRVVADEGRRAGILSELDQWESEQAKRDKAVGKDREALLETLRRKDATLAEVEPALTALDGQLLAMDRAFLDLRFRMKNQVTRAEWAQIVDRTGR